VSDEFVQQWHEAVEQRVNAAAALTGVTSHQKFQSPADSYSAMIYTLGHLERMTGILAELMEMKSRASRMLAAREATRDDAWNKAATAPAISFSQSDPAPRERYAKYALETMPQERKVREAKQLLSFVDEGLDIVKQRYWYLEKLHRDLEIGIRVGLWESKGDMNA